MPSSTFNATAQDESSLLRGAEDLSLQMDTIAIFFLHPHPSHFLCYGLPRLNDSPIYLLPMTLIHSAHIYSRSIIMDS